MKLKFSLDGKNLYLSIYSKKIDLDETIIENEINKTSFKIKKLKQYNISEIEINFDNEKDFKY